MADDITKRLESIRSMVGGMCSGLRPPKMSIPARPDVDEDFVISAIVVDAIDTIVDLRRKVEELSSEYSSSEKP